MSDQQIKELQERLYKSYEAIHEVDTAIRSKRRLNFNQRVTVGSRCVRCEGLFTQLQTSGKYLCSLCFNEVKAYIISKRSKAFDQKGDK